MITPEDLALTHEVQALADQERSTARDARLADAVVRAEADDLPHALLFAHALRIRIATDDHDLDGLARATAAIEGVWAARGPELEPIVRRHVTLAYWGLLSTALEGSLLPIDRLAALRDAFAAWCRRFGWGDRESAYFSFRLAVLRGDDDAAATHLRAWWSAPVDPDLPVSDDEHLAVAWETARGRTEEALALYRESLGHEHPSPHGLVSLHAAGLAALIGLGRDAEAARVHALGLSVPGSEPTIESVGPHLVWCARTGSWAEGIALLTPYAVLLEPEGRTGVLTCWSVLQGVRYAETFLAAAVAAGHGEDRLPVIADDSMLSAEDRATVAGMARPLARARDDFAALADDLAARIARVVGSDDVADLARFRATWPALTRPGTATPISSAGPATTSRETTP